MTNDIKKKEVDKLLDDIREASYQIIDMGYVSYDASYIVMDLATAAYEYEMIKQLNDNLINVTPKTDNVLEFRKKEGN